LDLYFLYDRKNMIYITEFGVEEEWIFKSKTTIIYKKIL
jgi:hypothetical protein